MPTVAEEGRFRFVVNIRGEHPPPHVHVKLPDGTDVGRIRLSDGEFMDEVPRGMAKEIRQAYRKHAVAIREAWDKYNAGRETGEE